MSALPEPHGLLGADGPPRPRVRPGRAVPRLPGVRRTSRALGTFTLRPLDPFDDAELVHGWAARPGTDLGPVSGARLQDVERKCMAIAAHRNHDAFIGLYDGEPAFLMERYDPAETELKGLYEAEPGDVGMRLLLAPAVAPPQGFGSAAITTVMEALFADPSVRRVLVGPDGRADAVHALHRAVGFEVIRESAGPEKGALLGACTRERFQAITAGGPR